MPTNQALARSAPLPRLVAPALWLTTCAVPVLPAKSMPSMWTAAAVPVVVVPAMASEMVSQLAEVMGTTRSPEPGSWEDVLFELRGTWSGRRRAGA